MSDSTIQENWGSGTMLIKSYSYLAETPRFSKKKSQLGRNTHGRQYIVLDADHALQQNMDDTNVLYMYIYL